MNRVNGFTLLELVVVIIIIAILAAIAIPRITVGTASARASRAAQTIANYNNFVKACLSSGITEAATAAAVTAGTTPAGVDIQCPLTGTNSDGMWTYSYATPSITATKVAAPQQNATIIYNTNTNAWTGTYNPLPTSA